jgi:flagellar protein FlaJ
MKYSEIAFRVFGRFTRGKRYIVLQEALRRARATVTADIYAAMAIFSACLSAIAGMLLGFFISFMLGLSPIFAGIVSILVGSALGGLAYFVTIQYPSVIASERARKIDLALPYSLGFMHAMSRSEATIVDIFRELSTRKDMGELQKEAQVFMRDIEYLGRDPVSALRSLARSTPSEKFRGFLEVLVSIIETGGDVTPYLATKVSEFHTALRDENKKIVSSMELMAELYVIMVQFLPLLFLAILIFIGFMPNQVIDINLLRILVYVWVPLGSIMFAILLATIPPVELKGRPSPTRLPSPFQAVPVVSGGEYDKRILKRLRGAVISMKLKRFISNPFRAAIQKPSYILLVSAPAASLYLLFTPIKTFTLCMTFFIGALPYIIFYELKSKRAAQFEAALPNFLKSLSSASRSGLPLPRALQVTSASDFGAMTEEVRRAGRDIQWGTSANEALAKLEGRVSISPTVARTMTLIRKASEAEEDISEVVDISLQDVQNKREIVNERKSAMFIFRLTLLMSFVVFLITIYFIVWSYMLMPVEVEVGQMKIKGLDPMEVKLLFYHLLVLQAVFVGLIGGQMGTGDMRSGVKFAFFLLILAVFMFEIVLLPMGPPIITPPE